MKVALIGGTGLLGRYLINTRPEGVELIVTTHGHISNVASRKGLLFWDQSDYFTADVTIYLAGINSPEQAEEYPIASTKANVIDPLVMFEKMKENSKFIYISSNGVYAGEFPQYNETDVRCPVNLYGMQKNLVEEAIGKQVTVIRPSLLYGWTGSFTWARKNIVQYAIEETRKGNTIYCYDDIFCKPLYAGQCAAVIWKIIEHGLKAGESWNIAGAERCSIYELAFEAIDQGAPGMVVPVHYDGTIERPQDTSFDTTKIERELEIIPLDVRQGLARMREEELV